MKITRQEVQHVADLARLRLSDAELASMTAQLDTILSYVDKLGELDTTEVAPTTHALAVTNAFREDQVKASLDQREALGGGPETGEDCFIVPRVI